MEEAEIRKIRIKTIRQMIKQEVREMFFDGCIIACMFGWLGLGIWGKLTKDKEYVRDMLFISCIMNIVFLFFYLTDRGVF